MAAEIAEQPVAWSRLLEGGRSDAVRVAQAVRSASPRFVLFAARGTSDSAALYARYLCETVLGLPCGSVSPSTVTVYGARPDLRDVLLVAVSQSGGSPDLVETTSVARECGALTLAVTNTGDSDLARAADLHLDVMAGPEKAVAATKTYTAELLALWLLVDAWRGGDGSRADVLPELGSALLESCAPEVGVLAARLRFADTLLTTGRGYSYPSAVEAALKLTETTYVPARAWSGADLLHGPLAAVDADTPVLAAAGSRRGAEALVDVLERVRGRGGDVSVVGPATGAAGAPALTLPDVDEELAPLLEILPLQLLCLEMARARGLDPDAPRGLAKVTRTR
ncbi:SIS domain-containing protein [Motilibacter rhizosphaerae]